MAIINKLFSKKYFPKIETNEIDVTQRKIHHPVTSKTKTGPVNKPIFLGPYMSKPKWYQFWKFKKYKEECKNTQQKIISVFGKPEKENNEN